MKTEEEIRAQLRAEAASGTPKLKDFALWLLDNLSVVAFESIRGLAQIAEVNPNTVIRMAQQMGYDGYDSMRRNVQEVVGSRKIHYGSRADALRGLKSEDLYNEIGRTSLANAEAIFSPDILSLLDSCIEPLLAARKVHCIGVRGCYAVAHYFSYLGAMAFENVELCPSMPGGIPDQMYETDEDDIVIAITYDHYSAEVVRACKIARSRGAQIIALTDSHSSPIALDAWKVIKLPMAGPQFMPSLIGAFAAVEVVLAAMAARSKTASARLATKEARARSYRLAEMN